MRGVYTVVFSGVAVTAQQDFFEITPADDRPIAIIGWEISQESDVGDAAEEMLRYIVWTGHSTSGSGGTAPTPQVTDTRDAAAGFTSEVNNTTIASAGTLSTKFAGAFNIRTGTGPVFLPPECWIKLDQGSGVLGGIRLLTTPADSLTMSGTLWVKSL